VIPAKDEDPAGAEHGGGLGDVRKQALDAGDREAARLRHERRDLVRVERVHVERDIDARGVLERALDGSLARMEAARGDELLLGWVQVPCADERDVVRGDRTRVEQHAERHPPEVPGRRRLRRVEVSVRVEPDQGDPAVARGEALHGADVGAAAAAQDERPLGELGREGERLLAQRVLGDHRRLRVRKQQRGRRLLHRIAALPPRARHADEPRGELAAAGVALVADPGRDRGERAAVGAASAQRTHEEAFS
jgi:hypothetical protein